MTVVFALTRRVEIAALAIYSCALMAGLTLTPCSWEMDEAEKFVFALQKADYLEPSLHSQSQGTCYAHACAQGIVHATRRTIRKYYPDSQDLAANIISRFGSDGGNVYDVLAEFCPTYSLFFAEVDDRSAIHAVQKGRWIVAAFDLTMLQWESFDEYFNSNPMGVLTKEILDSQQRYRSESDHPIRNTAGHAVVLTSADHHVLTFRNSWGQDWGFNGHFRVENSSVFESIIFFDIFSMRGC